ncbi:MAG: DUF1772 domain-containing protein [Pseudonocardiaceae bacterium]
MLEVLRGAALVAATLVTGLQAGLYYAFAVSVMPGLGRVDDRAFVEAMQQINVAIINPWFFLSFFGAPVLTIVAAGLHLPAAVRAALPWIVAALVLTGVGFVLTVAMNVPLNDALDAAGSPDRIIDLAQVRASFEAAWVRWNIARAIAFTAAFGCLSWALMIYGRTRAGA